MALDFPTSPTVGQQYGGYVYDGTKWKVSTTSTAPAAVQPTPPTNPTVGDMWFNSTDGTMYFYYNDGSTAQWVESRAPIVANGYYSPNYIINGGFDIFQRYSFASQTASNYCLDRWYVGVGGTITVTQQTTGVPVGTRYCARIAYNASSSYGNLFTALESSMVSQLKGKTVTLSMKLRRNSSFATDINIFLEKNATADTLTGGTWNVLTSATITNSQLPTGTGSSDWYTATITATVPNDGTANGLRVRVGEISVGNSGAYYEISSVQLEEGSVATTFRRNGNSVAEELLSCQRYYVRLNQNGYESTFGSGLQTSTTAANCFVPLPVPLRTTPSSIGFSEVFVGDRSTVAMSATPINFQNGTLSCLTLAVSNSAFGAQFRPCTLQGKGTTPYNSYLEVSAEL